MKARSASLTLYHFEPEHHKEVCMWHDQDHKPEVVGTVPNIFISQRWVAPPELSGGGRHVRPQDTGLMVAIHELADSERRGAYASWHESVHLPMVLDTRLFTGAVKLMSDATADRDLYVVL